MTTVEKIIEALEQLLEEAEDSAEAYGEDRDIYYAKGIEAALDKARHIADWY